MSHAQFSKAGFLRAYALPVVLMLLIPAIGWLFANHAVERYDGQVRRNATDSVMRDKDLDEETRAQALEFYQTVPASVVCLGGTPQLEELKAGFGTTCRDYAQFFWMRRISIACIVVSGITFLIALVCVLASMLSQRMLHVSFLTGWNVLKVASLLQALSQGVIAVLLSFWMTALWGEQYYPKIIFLVGTLAALAVWLIVKAVFAPVDVTLPLEGVRITPDMAPDFWRHVRQMCQTLGTEPPAQIVAGVDDNFFVTENPVILDGKPIEGRTLYVSLSLLKFMEKREADAVLAHEMAHFSGQDTHYTRKMSPLLARYGEYLTALYRGWISRPIFYFMLFFWALFQLSINRMSRMREFRADSISVETTSSADAARALLKVAAYSSYRSRIEHALFSENSRQEDLGIASRIAAGFKSYASSPQLGQDLSTKTFPHPFDTHPPLGARLTAIRTPILPTGYARVLHEPVKSSWVADIHDVERLEHSMWTTYEERFSAAHEESLAWRYRPDTLEERAIVEKHFPEQRKLTKKNDATLVIDFQQILFSEWGIPVAYGDIKSCAVRESFGRRILTLKLTNDRKKVEFNLNRFADGNEVVACFERYYARHTAAAQHKASGGADANAA